MEMESYHQTGSTPFKSTQNTVLNAYRHRGSVLKTHTNTFAGVLPAAASFEVDLFDLVNVDLFQHLELFSSQDFHHKHAALSLERLLEKHSVLSVSPGPFLTSEMPSMLQNNRLSPVDLDNVKVETPRQDLDLDHYASYPHSSFLLDSLAAGVADHHDYDEFNLDSMEFIAPQNLGHDSRAFPPLEFPENTPSLVPANAQSSRGPRPPQMANLLHLAMVFSSPILPSQNSKSYNQEHLIQKQLQQQKLQQQQRSGSRHSTPSMALQTLQTLHLHHHTNTGHGFTPLVSPAVTPLDLHVNSNKHHFAPAATDFEPLTSPALKAQLQAGASSSHGSSASLAIDADRRRSLAAFAGDDYVQGNSTKRRTPHLTPKLLAVALKLKPSPSVRKPPLSEPGYTDSQKLHSSELTPMLPPQGKKVVIDSNQQQMLGMGADISPTTGFGPGTLMSFTMNRLAEQQGDHSSMESTSAVAGESSPSHPSLALQHTGTFSASTSAPTSAPAFTSLSETSPVIEAMTDDNAPGGKRIPGKKTSHKIAEQGRRIRMNQAVHELSRLIPSHFQDCISVPSKATTIELAAVYIRDLQREIESLKRHIAN